MQHMNLKMTVKPKNLGTQKHLSYAFYRSQKFARSFLSCFTNLLPSNLSRQQCEIFRDHILITKFMQLEIF